VEVAEELVEVEVVEVVVQVSVAAAVLVEAQAVAGAPLALRNTCNTCSQDHTGRSVPEPLDATPERAASPQN
jgi:hypothetical protein